MNVATLLIVMINNQPLVAKAGNGQLSFDGKQVVITRRGLGARMTVGSGTKSIPISSITAVRFRPSGIVSKGFVQFSVIGDTTAHGNLTTGDLDHDENTLMIHNSMQTLAIMKVVTAIKDALTRRESISTTSEIVINEGPTESRLDSLLKLAELRDRGVLTVDEFETEKQKLIGGDDSKQSEELRGRIDERQDDISDTGYLWILSLPPRFDKIFDEVCSALGLPAFDLTKKRKLQRDIYAQRKDLIDFSSLIRLSESLREPARLNRLVSRTEFLEISQRLASLRVISEFRPNPPA